MAWITEEEYQAAKQVRAYEYLQTYQPGRLKKTRTSLFSFTSQQMTYTFPASLTTVSEERIRWG